MSTIKMIYDSTCDIQDYQTYLDMFLEEMGISKASYELTPKVWEEELSTYIQEEKEIEYNNEITNILFHENKYGEKMYVVKGLIGLWQGTFDGGKIVKGMENVILKCSETGDSFKFFMEGRVMRFMTFHHDGTNNFWIKELTKRGEKYYEVHKDELSDREMVEKLYNDRHLSKHVTLWHDMYGM